MKVIKSNYKDGTYETILIQNIRKVFVKDKGSHSSVTIEYTNGTWDHYSTGTYEECLEDYKKLSDLIEEA